MHFVDSTWNHNPITGGFPAGYVDYPNPKQQQSFISFIFTTKKNSVLGVEFKKQLLWELKHDHFYDVVLVTQIDSLLNGFVSFRCAKLAPINKPNLNCACLWGKSFCFEKTTENVGFHIP